MENNDIMTLLKNKTNQIKIFCLKMQEDYNYYYESLSVIEDILKNIDFQISSFNDRLNQESLSEEERTSLIEQKDNLTNKLGNWKKEEKDYITECNKIKDELQKLGVTNDNTILFEENPRYTNLIKKITVYNFLKAKKETDSRILYQQELAINEEYHQLFNTTEDLIPKSEKSNSKFVKDVVDSINFDKVANPQIPFLVEPEEEVIILPGTLKRERERVKNRYKNLHIAAVPFSLRKEPTITFEQEKNPLLTNPYKVNEKKPDLMEEPPTPLIDRQQEEVVKKMDVEEAELSDTIKRTIEKRIENYDHYWKFLFRKMDDYTEKAKELKNVINKKMEQNESITVEARKLEATLKIQGIITKEIQRLSEIKPEDKKNVYLNLNIPNLDMSEKEIEEYLVNKKPFDYVDLPRKFPLQETDSLNKTPSNDVKRRNEQNMLEQLEIIKKLKKDNVDNEKIIKILEILSENKNPQEKKKSSLGKVFRWCRKALKKTTEKYYKNRRIFLAFEKIFDHKESVSQETQSNIVQPDIVSEVSNERAPIIKEDKEVLLNETPLTNPINVEEIKIHLGDNFVIDSNALIYSDEYLEKSDKPTYSPDTIRECIGFGVRKADGTVELVRTEKRLEELINASGKQISVLAFDGFFNINEIQKQKGLSR